MPKVFISYKRYEKTLNNTDETVARKLYDKLRAAGFECWMDQRDMPVVTKSWVNNIVTAIEQCDLVVMVVSKHAQKSETIRKRELSVITEFNKPIIPFRIDQSKLLPEFLWAISSSQWVNAWDDYESKIDEVISKLRLQLGDPLAPESKKAPDKESTEFTAENDASKIDKNKHSAFDYIEKNGKTEDIPHLENPSSNYPNEHTKRRSSRIIKKKVLCFDDESFISSALVSGLKLQGWDVTPVSKIDDLFQKLSYNHYDVLIMDIMAPVPESSNIFTQKEINEMSNGMNTGIVLAKKIWQMEEYKDVPFLFLSSRTYPRSLNHDLMANKKYCYLRKPETANVINKKLMELLNY